MEVVHREVHQEAHQEVRQVHPEQLHPQVFALRLSLCFLNLASLATLELIQLVYPHLAEAWVLLIEMVKKVLTSLELVIVFCAQISVS